MATPPLKPWERPGVNYNSLNCPTNTFTSPANQFINDISMQGPGISGFVGTTGAPINPPPLPPRPVLQQRFGNSSYGYGSPFSSGPTGYGYSPYSSMFSRPMFSSYGGGYGMGYNPYTEVSQNGFVQMAEESSRPAFQSIESIVHAVGSVSMMLESTYGALYSSFRAVLGVAHHFGQMKTQMAQILSALAIIRSLRWLYRKILYMIGINKINPVNDDIWSTVTKTLNETELPDGDVRRKKSNWPIVVFLAVIFGGPWLLWKLLMSMYNTKEEDSNKWMSGTAPHFVAVALFNFRGEQPNELSFAAKEVLRIAPKELQPKVRGWLLASLDGKTTGLIPANYVKIYTPSNSKRPETAETTQLTPPAVQQAPVTINEPVNKMDEELANVTSILE
ncbi:Peroxisomal membrane protein PAS20 [Chamberlinius hualienensis]